MSKPEVITVISLKTSYISNLEKQIRRKCLGIWMESIIYKFSETNTYFKIQNKGY